MAHAVTQHATLLTLALGLALLGDCTAGSGTAMLSRKFKKTFQVPFRKPKDPAAETRHLYCCNCPPLPEASAGAGAGAGADDWRLHPLVEACSGHAAVEDFFTVAGKPWAVLSFADSRGAAAAMRALQGAPLLGRPVHVQFTEAVPDKKPPAVARVACTSETRDVEIPGLVLRENFVSTAEEADILAQLDALPWEAQMSRRVQHFGFAFDYSTRKCSAPAAPLPACLELIAARALSQGLLTTPADQCTVNEYLPGQGIRSHIDTHSAFHDGLLSVSLGTQVVMDFKRGEAWCSQGSPREGTVVDTHKSVVLPPRSALSRYYQSICLSVCLSIYLSVYLSIYFSVYLDVGIDGWISISIGAAPTLSALDAWRRAVCLAGVCMHASIHRCIYMHAHL